MSYVSASLNSSGVSTSATCYVNVVDNTADSISIGATTCAIEVINDSPDTNIAVNFTTTAAIPSNTTSVIANHLVRPKEARFFQVATSSCSIIAASGSQQVRLTFFIP